MIRRKINMIGVVVTIVLLLIAVALVAETIMDKRNPTPLMSNDDKKFIFVNNIKTRKMYDGIKR